MATPVQQRPPAPFDHWSAKHRSITLGTSQIRHVVSTAMGVSCSEFDETVGSIRAQKAGIQQALAVLRGIDVERTRFQNEAATLPDLKERIAVLETAEAEASQRLASFEGALDQAQSALTSAEKERDAVKAKFSDVCERLRTAARGKRTELSERKRVLQIDTSKRFSACSLLQKEVDAAQANMDREKMRLSRIREEKSRHRETQRSAASQLAHYQERWNQATGKVQDLQARLDAFIRDFIAKNYDGEESADKRDALYYLQNC